MRLGTITVHNGYNYGASLQAYALVEFLRQDGHDASLIDYRTQKIENKHVPQKSQPGIKRIVRNTLLNGKGYDLRRQRFDAFNRKIMSPDAKTYYRVQELEEVNGYYDGFLCGSDQIWNPAITDADPAFFLSFAGTNKRRVSYAPSLGVEVINDEEFFRKMLKNIDVLSVREEYNAADIARLAEKDCSVVLDPVLLLTKDQWERVAESAVQIKPKKPYVFYYTLHPDENLFEHAKIEAKRRGALLVRTDILPLKAYFKGCRSVAGKGVGPAEFVQLMRGADYVITNSFHGTAFSILFQKPFSVKLLGGNLSGKNLRITQLLSALALQDRILYDNQINEKSIDWTKCTVKLNELRKHSATFLRNALI